MPEFPIYVIELDGDTWFCRNDIENNFPESQYAFSSQPERALHIFRFYCDKTIIEPIAINEKKEGFNL